MENSAWSASAEMELLRDSHELAVAASWNSIFARMDTADITGSKWVAFV